MKTTLLSLTAAALGTSGLLAANDPTTALDAIKLLPKTEAKKIARIEARDGTPAPDRWYVIAFDEKSESGVREYAVAGGEIVATRAVSQFAEALKPEDVVGGDAVRIDSDKAAKLAQQYALANNATVASLNYELKRDGEGAAPLWTVTCLDEAGKELGRVVVTAGKGNVVSHEGFAVEPGATVSKEKVKTQASAIVGAEPVAVTPERQPQPPRTEERERKGFFGRVGNTLKKTFTGGR